VPAADGVGGAAYSRRQYNEYMFITIIVLACESRMRDSEAQILGALVTTASQLIWATGRLAQKCYKHLILREFIPRPESFAHGLGGLPRG
jgi:hypothetical protein